MDKQLAEVQTLLIMYEHLQNSAISVFFKFNRNDFNLFIFFETFLLFEAYISIALIVYKKKSLICYIWSYVQLKFENFFHKPAISDTSIGFFKSQLFCKFFNFQKNPRKYYINNVYLFHRNNQQKGCW